MNYRQYLDKHRDGSLSDTEWERLAQQMMQAQFDREKSAAWARTLEQNGTSRNAPTLRIQFRRLLFAAAAVFVLGLAALWFFYPSSGAVPAQRLASNYLEQPFPLNAGASRGDQATDFNRGRALEAFNNRQYEKSVRYLQQVEAEGRAKAPDFFQMGLCLMYQRRPDYLSALEAFAKAQEADPAVYADEIKWFSGLCYLMLGNDDQARTALQQVADSPSARNRDAAIELLKAMK